VVEGVNRVSRVGKGLGALSVVVLSACAGAPPHIELEPMHFSVVDGESGRRVQTMDPEVLYEEAERAYRALDYAVAADKYGLVADYFPTSRFAVASAYNAGVSLEKLRRYEAAAARFEGAVELAPGTRDAQDALFRAASSYEALEDWAALRGVGDRLLAPHFEGLSAIDRMSAHAVRGRGAEGESELALAERDYRETLRLHQRHLGMPGLEQSPFVSLAQFRIGEIYRTLFASIQFRLPLERMARDLEDKSNFFLMAQTAYLRALRLRHPEWAVIAGYRLGLLYEVMYDDMMSAEVPSDLTREEVELYYEELRSQVRPLLERAIDIYERNLRLAQRFGKDGAWMKRTEASLARLRDVMRSDAGRDAELQVRDRR